jgi:hypothetical protein
VTRVFKNEIISTFLFNGLKKMTYPVPLTPVITHALMLINNQAGKPKVLQASTHIQSRLTSSNNQNSWL